MAYFDGCGVSKEDREAFMKTPTLLQFKAAGNAGTMDFSGGEGLNLTALCAVLHPDCPVPFACTVLNVSGCSLGVSEGGIKALVSVLEKNSTITKVRQLMLSTSTSYFLTSILTPCRAFAGRSSMLTAMPSAKPAERRSWGP